AWIRLGALGEGMRRLHEAQVKELVLAGPVRRPSFAEIRPDFRAAQLLARIGRSMLGDDSVLSAIVRELESEGFAVIGVDEILKYLLMPEGLIGRIVPDAQAEADIARGIVVARALGAVDVGQGVV